MNIANITDTSPKLAPVTEPPWWSHRLVVCVCRIYYLTALGLGCSSFAVIQPAHIVLLAGISCLLVWRWHRGDILILPDGILFCLPYFWAMNAVHGFEAWWAWFVPLFLVAFGPTAAFIFLNMRGRPHWRIAEFGRAILLSFLFVALFSSLLRLIFPLFTLDNFRNNLVFAFLFFGGIPICQLAMMRISNLGWNKPEWRAADSLFSSVNQALLAKQAAADENGDSVTS